jgi:thioredoxin reductase/bacterioferritin-associated ferredoxin
MDVLVIGGGPAGMAAACVVAEAGLDVVLVDERGKLGGQYYKQPVDPTAASADRQVRDGRALIQRVRESGARVLRGVTIWAAYGSSEVMALGNDANYVLRPKRLIVATGAYDRAVPMPGWTLPGFVTTGAAQSLLRAYGVTPGNRVAISGNGPLNIQLAAELTRAGVEVVALAELAPAPGPRSVGRLAAMLWNGPDLLRDGAGYLRTLWKAGVSVQYGHAVIAASGTGRIEQATLARVDGQGRPVPGSERVLDVDAVCAGFGFLPSNEVPRALGCRHRFDPSRGPLEVVRDSWGRTSVEHVAVIGDGGGIQGGRVAVAQGILAGVDAARSLGKGDAPSLERETRAAQKTVRSQQRFQRALWALYDAPLLVDQLATDETHICRCEEVTLKTIREAMEGGVHSLGALKRLTRAGMGRCQGRYCAGIMVGMLPEQGTTARDEMDFFAPRAPFKPVPIGAVASGPFTESEMAQRGKEAEGPSGS